MAWERVAAAADVPEDGTLPVRFRGAPVCLYIVDGRIECPLHQGMFDIATGKALAEPCTVDLRVYLTKVENGQVLLAEPQ